MNIKFLVSSSNVFIGIFFLQSSREYYKPSFGWKTRKVTFLFLDELNSLIKKSIIDQLSQNILPTNYLMLPEVKNEIGE